MPGDVRAFASVFDGLRPGMTKTTVIFDLGGVLLDWNPRHLYRKLFTDEVAMEHFLANVCTNEWHLQHDAGRPFVETCTELKQIHPQHGALIDAFGRRQQEMFKGVIPGTVAILDRLAAHGTKLYALTNFPAETYDWASKHFDFFRHFIDVTVSGREKVLKPDPEMWRILLKRNGIEPQDAVYIDDNAKNAQVSRTLGLHGIHFTSPEALERELVSLGLLDRA
jgi:2-haloacid dehalogenase